MFETNSLNYLQIFEGFFLGAVLIHTIYSLFAFFGFKRKGDSFSFSYCSIDKFIHLDIQHNCFQILFL